MSLYSIPNIIAGLFVLGLGIFVYSANPGLPKNRYFFLHTSIIFCWQISYAVMYSLSDYSKAMLFARIGHASAVLLSPCVYYFAIAVVGHYATKTDYVWARAALFYSLVSVFLALFYEPYIPKLVMYEWGYYPRGGVLMALYAAWTGILAARVLFLLYKSARAAVRDLKNDEYQRFKYYALTLSIFILSALDYLPKFGLSVYPFGYVFVGLFALLTAYAIVKHSLWDVRVVIKKTLLYAFWTFLISIGYAISIFLIQQVAFLKVDVLGIVRLYANINFIFVWSGFFSLVVNVGLGLFIYFKEKHSPTAVRYALLSLCIGLWSCGSSLINVIPNKEMALWILRINYAFGVFVPCIFLDFTFSLIGKSNKEKIKIGYFLSILYLCLTTTPLFIKRLAIIPEFNFYISDPGPLYFSFIIYFCVFMSYGLAHLYARIRANANQRGLFLLVLFAYAIGMLAGIEYFSSVLGVLKRPPLDDYLLVVSFFLIAYAIARYKFLNLKLIVKKTAAYSFFAILVSIFYTIIIFIAYRIFVGERLPQYYLTNSLVLILLISLFLRPVEVFLKKYIDRRFYKGTIEEIAEQKDLLQIELERRERLKSVGILAAGMAHEIKNPLTAIRTFAEYLPEKSHDAEFIQKFQKIVMQETERIRGIVGDLLAFSKPSEPKRKPTDVNLLIRNTADLLGNQMLKANTTIQLNLTSAPAVCNIDPDQIKQALLNIVLNAIEAMAPQGGAITIKSTAKNGVVDIAVQDTGPGIDPGKIAHIFDPFYTDKADGTGLGLAVTHSLIEKNGGKISVENLRPGAKFTLSFPVHT